MPSVEGEGIHRVRFDCVLSCRCLVIYRVRPPMRSHVYCIRHEDGATVTEITRHELLPEPPNTVIMGDTG